MNKEILRAKISKKIFILPGILGGIFILEGIVFSAIETGIGILPLILGVLILAPAVIKYMYTDLILYDNKIRGQIGFLRKQSLDAPLDKINDVYVNQGIIGRMLGYGNINISTSSNNFNFKGIAYCEVFKNKVIEQIEIYKKEQLEEQAKLMAEAMKNANK